ncbi:MAG: hypothetical protein Q7T36_13755 [Fluviicoccus sp.]|uniref:hypothetical protein n=1 Tax=Fluviicoccus sp. TaxID=2003552 RepID=UPI002725F126|nr:hypothetical protein [Fluviicoccus sp.]MDO8331525.1 hypothetical protein [Fluviicoccus sp.]
MAGPFKIFMGILICGLIVAWWYRGDIRQRWEGAEVTKTRLFQWKNSEGNTSFSDRAGSPGAGVVVVDTSRITPLTPVKTQAKAPPEKSGDLSLQEFGKEMQAKQLEFREKQMQMVLDGKVPDPRR